MKTLGLILTLVLLIQSVLGLALLIQAVLTCRLQRSTGLHHLTALLTLLRQRRSVTKGRMSATELSGKLSLSREPLLDRAVTLLLQGERDLARITARQWIGQLDRGAARLGGLLTRTAPLMGLGGTLAGISMSMAEFAQKSADASQIINGFSVAIETTLYGIFVACFCQLAVRLFWQPFQERAAGLWCELEAMLQGNHAEHRSELSETPIPRVADAPKGIVYSH
jgi:biopolymer transport protein ExbB/TolQ